jgi:hypothetical protein
VQGGIEQDKQFLSEHEEGFLKPSFNSKILGLLLTSFSTKGTVPLLFLLVGVAGVSSSSS